MTFLPGFVPHGQSVGPTTALFGAIFVVETAIYFAVLLLLVDRIARLMRSARAAASTPGHRPGADRVRRGDRRQPCTGEFSRSQRGAPKEQPPESLRPSNRAGEATLERTRRKARHRR